MALLELKDITKYYGDFKANDNISFEIQKGKIHAIIGENGAGKSTLMNMISGVLEPTGGHIVLKGEKVQFSNPNDATKAKIGMVQQEFMLFDDLTVAENIVLGFEDLKNGNFLDLEKSKRKIKEICEEYSFSLPLNAYVKDLPLAVQQQVEIVKVLFKDAEVIILDEPTAILTPQGIEGLFDAMKFLISQGKTILFITHKLKEVLEIADNISVLKDGKHVDTFKNKNITEEDLAKAMVGRDVILEIERKLSPKNDRLLSVRDLSVTNSRGITKVNNVTFDLYKGEVVGVVGIANNGQSELVEAITGLQSYQTGIVELRNKTLEQNNPKINRIMKMGYVPQDRVGTGSSLESSILENAIIGRHLTHFRKGYGIMDWTAADEYTNEIINKFDVRCRSNKDKISSLSGGNMQKLIVGREFTQNNEVLVIEDPVRGIDIGSIEFIWNEIKHQVENNNTGVLLVTYDLNEAITLSDRIIVMREGKIVKEFSRNEFDEYEIGLYMLGGKDEEFYSEK